MYMYDNVAFSENSHTLPKEGYWKFSRGGGRGSKAILFERNYETKLEFLRGVRDPKKLSVRGVWIFFWNNSI